MTPDGEVTGGEGDDADLRTDVGLLEAVGIEVGLIVGAGLFSLTGVATSIAGPAVFLSFLLAFAVVVPSIVPTAILGSAYPTTGGNYRYPSRFVSQRVAFVAVWGLAISMFAGGLPLYALTFGEYAAALVPVDPRLVGVAVLTAFWLVNLAGIKMAARVQFLLIGTLVASLVVFVLLGAPAVQAGNVTPLFPNGLAGVATGAALLYFVCLGANFIVDVGDEVASATTTIPKSFAISVPVVMVLYVATSFVAVGTVGWQALSGATLSVPAEAFLSPTLSAFFIVGGALFASATTTNGVFIIAPKYLVVVAEDGLVPERVAAVNERFGTPHWSLTVVYLVSVAMLFSPLPLGELGVLLGFGGILAIVPTMVAGVVFARRRPGEYRRTPFSIDRRLLTVVAAVAVVCNLALLGLLALNSLSMFVIWVGGLVLGDTYYALRKRWLTDTNPEPAVPASEPRAGD